MNQFIAATIAEKVSDMETAVFFERHAAQADRAKADAAWGKVGQDKPLPEDQWRSSDSL
jgi:hypothetical protein